MLAAAPVFGQDAGAMLVRSVTGRLTGLFPARIERPQGGLVPMLCGWTHPFAPLGVPLVDRDDTEAVIEAWLDQLAGDRGMPALLMMPYIPEQGAFADALGAVLSQTGRASAAFGQHVRALLDPGAERDNYLARAVSSGRRKEMRRQFRRLEEFGPVTFDTIADPDDIPAALKDFLVLEASGWKGVAGTAIVDEPSIKAFVQTAVTSLAAEGHARIDRMLLDGRPIAVTVTLRNGDTAWCWKIAYNEGMARFSPGVQLICELTEKLAADRQVARTDSCATADHPMINHIWRERLSLSDRLIALKPSAVPFGMARGLESLRRHGIATAKSLRDRIRNR
jgi:CelD/BcsL family acetyltransferase involved in cellulose biosynthesis